MALGLGCPSLSLPHLAFGNCTFQLPRGSYHEAKYRLFQQVFIEKKKEQMRTLPNPKRFVCIGFCSSRTILTSARARSPSVLRGKGALFPSSWWMLCADCFI